MALPRAFQATRIGHRSQMKCLSISLQLYFEDSLFAVHPDALPDEMMRLWGLTKKQVFGELTGGYTVTGGRKEIMERGHRSAPLQDYPSGLVILTQGQCYSRDIWQCQESHWMTVKGLLLALSVQRRAMLLNT